MRHRIAILGGAAAIAAGWLGGCGDGHGQPAPAATPSPSGMSQSLNSAQVLAQARQTSETTEPYAVNAGVLMLTDSSDTNEPISINGA